MKYKILKNNFDSCGSVFIANDFSKNRCKFKILILFENGEELNENQVTRER